jgi:hypothetical protein
LLCKNKTSKANKISDTYSRFINRVNGVFPFPNPVDELILQFAIYRSEFPLSSAENLQTDVNGMSYRLVIRARVIEHSGDQ